MSLPVAIQLYSLRDDLDRDFKGTLEEVKRMGYDGVEFAGLGNNSPETVKAWVDELGLTPISAHVAIEDFLFDDDGEDALIEKYEKIGCKYIAIPYLVEKRRPGGSDWEIVAEAMKRIGKKLKDRGMTLLYHNHDFEFKTKIDGEYALNVLYRTVPADVLESELDTCWVNIGGENPAEFIKQFKNRAPVVHLKDFYMTGALPSHLYALIGIDEEESEKEESTFEFRPVGHGMQDMPAILASAVEAGAKWVVVEQDDPSEGTTPIECAEKSIKYLRELEW